MRRMIDGSSGAMRAVRLRSLDAELGGLDDRRVVAVRLGPGPWGGPPPAAAAAGRGGAPLLVVSGTVTHDIELRGIVSKQLAMTGDVLLPDGEAPALLPVRHRWSVPEEAVVALLDRDLLHGPAASVVLERVAAVQARTALALAIGHLPRVEDRLLAMLLLLAEQRGRVTADGIVVDAFLTHAALGELIGARRPTVTLAFAVLRERARVRTADGTWIITVAAASVLEDPQETHADAMRTNEGLRAEARRQVRRAGDLRRRASEP
jgi:CRP/FNR family transcriptional regulator, cyclic AMP receptor protein